MGKPGKKFWREAEEGNHYSVKGGHCARGQHHRKASEAATAFEEEKGVSRGFVMPQEEWAQPRQSIAEMDETYSFTPTRLSRKKLSEGEGWRMHLAGDTAGLAPATAPLAEHIGQQGLKVPSR